MSSSKTRGRRSALTHQENTVTKPNPINGLDELEVITLLVEDVAACREFYTAVFGLEIIFENADSALFRLRNLMLNIVTAEEGPLLIAGTPTGGGRALYTIRVDDVDATAVELRAHGVDLVNGPIDRPWGRRTAAFADPAGNLWEIAQAID
jgi:catechol 2,3-dioxygenase-like lactoylglutathione lyase family enzyme